MAVTSLLLLPFKQAYLQWPVIFFSIRGFAVGDVAQEMLGTGKILLSREFGMLFLVC